MSNNTLEDTGKKSIRTNSTDQDNVEAAGYDLGTSTSTLFSELAEDSALLAELQEQKEEEVRQLRQKARDIETRWQLDE